MCVHTVADSGDKSEEEASSVVLRAQDLKETTEKHRDVVVLICK